MLFKFSSHTLEKVEDGYIVLLYMETPDEEFSNDFNADESPKGNDMLNRSIMSYIKEHLSTIKISLIKVFIGSVLLLTISMSALESSLQVAHASTMYSQAQIQEAINKTSANVVLNRTLLNMPQKPFIMDGVTYAPIREICEALGANVLWDEKSNYVRISKNNTTLSFYMGDNICILNDKKMDMPQPILVNHKTMVSLRFLSEIFGFNVVWNDKLKTAVISSTNDMPTEHELENIVPKPPINQTTENINYSQEDLNWLAKLVHAEASGESYSGKLAVANVIINRVNSSEFPDNVKSVIFDKKHGVQFTPTINGEIYKNPSQESTQAAIDALKGKNNAVNALYFLNPRKAPSSWIEKNRKYAFTLENHNFYF